MHRVLRQAKSEQVSGCHRVVAAHHDGGAQDRLERLGGRRVARRGTAEQSAQEPARAVDTDEAHRLHAALALGTGHRKGGEELAAEDARRLLDRALRGEAAADLVAHLVPDALGAGRPERHELHGRLAGDDSRGDDVLPALVEIETQLHALDAGDAHAAEVDAQQAVVGNLGLVERPLRAVVRPGAGRRRGGAVRGVVDVGPVGDGVDGLVDLDRVGLLAATTTEHVDSSIAYGFTTTLPGSAGA